MIKINLLVEARAEKVARKPLISIGIQGLNNFILAGVLLVGLLAVGVTYWRLSTTLNAIEKEIAVNQKEYDRLKPIIAEVEKFKKNNTELKHKIEVIEKLKANQYGPVRIMDEVSKALPDLLWLSDLNLSGNTITLKGRALNENAVANFISNLDASPYFAEPTLRIMSQDNKGVFSFDMACTFTYSPQEAGGASAPRS